MPSSTSSFERPIPALPGRRTVLLAVILLVAGLAGWELSWRAYGLEPDLEHDEGLWADQRRRIESEGDRGTVLIGSSRILFDVDLDTWAEHMGTDAPIQLAIEGTTPRPLLEDLANDEHFRGFLVVGFAPDLFYMPGEGSSAAKYVEYYRDESPSQRFGHVLWKALQSELAFLEQHARLGPLLMHDAPWPIRPGPRHSLRVLKMSQTRTDRNTYMWSRVETDREYRDRSRRVWKQWFHPFPPPQKALDKRHSAIAGAVERIRARGGMVVFVRLPSVDQYRGIEMLHCPRSMCWDRLLAATSAPGIHFEDHPTLQGFELPEWSHLRRADRAPFTAALVDVLRPLYQSWREQPR